MSVWSTAVADVRKILSDGPTDKLAYRKKVIGEQDGVNVVFKTFEARRISAFNPAPTAPIGVYKNNALQTVSTEDLESGEFTLSAAPANTDTLVATYYYRWFNDNELQEFLVDASEWIGVGTDYTKIDESLRPAAKEYAVHKAYQKLIAKMSVNLAETYQLYDAPDQKRFDPIGVYAKISKEKYEMAVKLRDDVYERKGQAKQPLSSVIPGRVRDVAPNR